MTNYIKNITGTEDSPLPQTLAYKEKGKGNVADKIKKEPAIAVLYEQHYMNSPGRYKDYVLIGPGEKIETKLKGENIIGEPRLKIIRGKEDTK